MSPEDGLGGGRYWTNTTLVAVNAGHAPADSTSDVELGQLPWTNHLRWPDRVLNRYVLQTYNRPLETSLYTNVTGNRFRPCLYVYVGSQPVLWTHSFHRI